MLYNYVERGGEELGIQGASRSRSSAHVDGGYRHSVSSGAVTSVARATVVDEQDSHIDAQLASAHPGDTTQNHLEEALDEIQVRRNGFPHPH